MFRQFRLKRRTFLLIAVVCASGILVVHRWLLTECASLLIVDQQNEVVTDVLILGGDQRFSVAGDFVHRDSTVQILLAEEMPSRLVKCEILPPQHSLDRRALERHGVPGSSIVLIRGRAETPWDTMRQLQGWLRANPEARVAVLSNRFRSRQQREILDGVLTRQEAARTFVWALRDRRYDESNWWYTRISARDFVYSWISLVALWVYGESEVQPRWNADAYEDQLWRIARGER